MTNQDELKPLIGYELALKSLGWREITLWYRFTDNGLEYNHFEWGHIKDDTPKLKSTKSSCPGRWSKLYTFMERIVYLDKVVDKVVFEGRNIFAGARP